MIKYEYYFVVYNADGAEILRQWSSSFSICQEFQRDLESRVSLDRIVRRFIRDEFGDLETEQIWYYYKDRLDYYHTVKNEKK